MRLTDSEIVWGILRSKLRATYRGKRTTLVRFWNDPPWSPIPADRNGGERNENFDELSFEGKMGIFKVALTKVRLRRGRPVRCQRAIGKDV
jgi:hypothetical protein